MARLAALALTLLALVGGPASGALSARVGGVPRVGPGLPGLGAPGAWSTAGGETLLGGAMPSLSGASALPDLPGSEVAPRPRVPARLGSPDYYQALLARQDAGETLDLGDVPRPGIARSNGATLRVLQGSGRFEKLRNDEPVDLFVADDDPLPEGVVVLQRGIPVGLVRAANTLSSRGPAGANPRFVEFVTEASATFARVLAPRFLVRAPLSVLDIRRRELEEELRSTAARLADEPAVDRLETVLASQAYQDMSVAEKTSLLERLLAP